MNSFFFNWQKISHFNWSSTSTNSESCCMWRASRFINNLTRWSLSSGTCVCYEKYLSDTILLYFPHLRSIFECISFTIICSCVMPILDSCNRDSLRFNGMPICNTICSGRLDGAQIQVRLTISSMYVFVERACLSNCTCMAAA
jgi:hypothetical protein